MSQWTKICKKTQMIPDTGLCAKGKNDEQIAFFWERKSDKLFAVSNHCPFANANVLSRGLLAELDGVLSIASPIYKQHFNLETGICLEDESVSIKSYEIRETEGQVEILL